jgi:hypothetical protein
MHVRSLPHLNAALREPAAVFVLLLTVYLFSAPRGVLLDDDGYFILAAYFNGVAHPPGYPLYTLFANLFTHLPWGSVAFRVHACSAVFGALCCAVLWDVARRLSGSRVAAWTTALCCGLSSTFWTMSTTAEVYTLNALLFFTLLWLCLLPGADARRGVLIAGLFGLSLCNHWPLMIASAPALLAVLWPRRCELCGKPLAMVAALSGGLLPYLWMVYRSRVSEIAFFGPIGNFADFWFYVSRAAYAEVDRSLGNGLIDRLRFAGFSLDDAWQRFGTVAVLLAIAGLIAQWRSTPGHLRLALPLAFAGNSLLLALLLGFDWDFVHRNVFAQYPLVAHGVLALWLAQGVCTIATRLRNPGWATVASVFVVASVALNSAPANLRVGSRWAADFGTTLLEDLKPGAALFLHGDYAVGPVAYLNRIEGLRPDVDIFNVRGQLFTNRLLLPRDFDADPRSAWPIYREYIERTPRPIHFHPDMPWEQGLILHGLSLEAARDLPAGAVRIDISPRVAAFFEQLRARGAPAEPGELIHLRLLESTWCRALAAQDEENSADESRRRLERHCSGYYGLIERAALILRNDGDATQALRLLERAAPQQHEAVAVRNLAALDNLYARAFRRLGDETSARGHLRRSIERWPDLANPAHRLWRAAPQP